MSSFLFAEAFTCLLRLRFGCDTSESANGVGSGERPLLAGAFLLEVEEDLTPTGVEIFWEHLIVVSTATGTHLAPHLTVSNGKVRVRRVPTVEVSHDEWFTEQVTVTWVYELGPRFSSTAPPPSVW